MNPALSFLASQHWAVEPVLFGRLVDLLAAHAEGVRLDPSKAAAFTSGADTSGTPREPGITWQGTTAIIPVRGVMARYSDRINGACQPAGRSADALQNDLLAAADQATQIVLRIDSPGGEVNGTAETASLIRQISASGVPVIAYVDGLCASAAYWIASQCDEIVASAETAQVGSIGVATTLTQTAPDAKRTVHVITSAPAKASPVINDAHLANAKSIVSDLARAFAGAVADGRGLTEEQAAAVATGEIWTAAQGLALGLVDRIAPFSDVIGSGSSSPSSQFTPAAAAATEQEPPMALDMKSLAAITAKHQPHAALIVAEAAKEGATEATITAAIAAADAQAAVAAKDAEIATLRTRAETAEAKVKADADAKTKAEADLKTANEQLAKFGAHAVGHKDPGNLGADVNLANTKTGDQFLALTPDERAAFRAKGGQVVN